MQCDVFECHLCSNCSIFVFFWLQLGLFVDFDPEEMLLGAEEGGDDGDLEAELAAITGEKMKEGKSKPKGKSKSSIWILFTDNLNNLLKIPLLQITYLKYFFHW